MPNIDILRILTDDSMDEEVFERLVQDLRVRRRPRSRDRVSSMNTSFCILDSLFQLI